MDPSLNATFSGGSTVACSFLDAQYRNFFATPTACRALALSAESRGCECSDPATSSEISSVEAIPTMDEGSNPLKGVSKMWALLGMGIVLLLACVVAYIRVSKIEADSSTGGVYEAKKEFSNQGEGDEPTLEAALAGISNHSSDKKRPVYTQSWTLWAGEQCENFDADTVDETLVEEA